MPASAIPIGSFVRFERQQLQPVIDRLRGLGYRTVGPRESEGAIVYADLTSVVELPRGLIDRQDGGCYRLELGESDAWFDYVVGPHSLKNFLFPPRETLLEIEVGPQTWEIRPQSDYGPPLAVIGVRSCDLHALRVQDQVFLGGPSQDPAYQARRERLFILAVNCRRSAATCFCHSMKTGPAVSFGFDLALTEIGDHFVVQVGSERGGDALADCNWSPCAIDEIDAARAIPARLYQQMQRRSTAADPASTAEGGDRGALRERHLDTHDLHDLLMSNLEHPRWQAVAERCLACANCTLVCPTCFCNSVQDVSDLTGNHVRRERSWASCFTGEHSYMNSGTVRKTTASQYRQWLTHKLATWWDQFGSSGCVGCGRCITWCPVGIDLTEEVAALRDAT